MKWEPDKPSSAHPARGEGEDDMLLLATPPGFAEQAQAEVARLRSELQEREERIGQLLARDPDSDNPTVVAPAGEQANSELP